MSKYDKLHRRASHVHGFLEPIKNRDNLDMESMLTVFSNYNLNHFNDVTNAISVISNCWCGNKINTKKDLTNVLLMLLAMYKHGGCSKMVFDCTKTNLEHAASDIVELVGLSEQ
jgi:hypothetical protein